MCPSAKFIENITLFEKQCFLSQLHNNLRLLFLILFINTFQLWNNLHLLSRKLLTALIINQQQLIDIILNNFHNPKP